VVDRPALRPVGADPAREALHPHALRRAGGEHQQQRDLGPVVEVVGDDGQRVLVQDDEQLVVAQAEASLNRGSSQKS
jgi:hypothetical protein